MKRTGENVVQGMNHRQVIEETWEKYTKDEHRRWSILFKRQEEILKNRAARAVLDGMKKLDICDFQIPKLDEINKILTSTTGFSVIPVDGLIPEDIFFELLALRKFPSTCFLRTAQQMDYLQEPDVFHDVFGHVPLLANPVFANLMEAFGKTGLDALDAGLYKYAAALYWFTIEFGLIQTSKGLRIYGAGITSSPGESVYSVESKEPLRFKFNPLRAMKTKFRIDRYQRAYFVIHNYSELFKAVQNLNWKELKPKLLDTPDFDEGQVVDSSELV